MKPFVGLMELQYMYVIVGGITYMYIMSMG